MFVLILLFVGALHAAATVPNAGWTFHPANSSNALLSTENESFKGTFVRTDATGNADLTLIVAEEKADVSSLSLKNWINTKYFAGKAVLLKEMPGKNPSKQLLIFQLPENDGLRVVSIYAFLKKGHVLLFSMESTLKSYQKDLKQAQSLIKTLH